MFADEKFTKNAAADRAKVLRATRLLPKLVLRIENFNKFVLVLGKKTKHDLGDLLHVGTVRDFKIRRSAFREVIERTANQSVDDLELLDAVDEEWHDSSEEGPDEFCAEDETTNDDQTISVAAVERALSATQIAAADCSASGTLVEANDVDMTRPDMALRNLALMNARLRRKRSLDPPPPPEEVENDPHGAEKASKTKKKKKPRIPLVINKASLEKSTRSTRSSKSSRD